MGGVTIASLAGTLARIASPVSETPEKEDTVNGKTCILGVVVALAAAAGGPGSLSWPGSAAADQLSAGSVELSPKVSFSHSNLKREGYANVDHFTQLDFTPTLGYCVTNHWEVTGGLLLRYQSENGMEDTSLGSEAGILYNFSPKGDVIPFAGMGFGVLFYDGFGFNETAVLAPDLSAGVRLLVGNSASVNLSLAYQRESDSHVRTNRMVAGVGVSLFPWKAH